MAVAQTEDKAMREPNARKDEGAEGRDAVATPWFGLRAEDNAMRAAKAERMRARTCMMRSLPPLFCLCVDEPLAPIRQGTPLGGKHARV